MVALRDSGSVFPGKFSALQWTIRCCSLIYLISKRVLLWVLPWTCKWETFRLFPNLITHFIWSACEACLISIQALLANKSVSLVTCFLHHWKCFVWAVSKPLISAIPLPYDQNFWSFPLGQVPQHLRKRQILAMITHTDLWKLLVKTTC